MHTTPIRIGTRGSPLALYQANEVADLLQARKGVSCEIIVIRTSGDRLADVSLSAVGGKRLFVKEIEDALLAGEIDLAVHSSKDLPALLPEGVWIGAVLPREDPRDAIVLPLGHDAGQSLDRIRETLGQAPGIGTSSVRRVAQLAHFSPGVRFLPVRGNLETRLRKLDSGDYDALVLAAAGLRRLEQGLRISALLPIDVCVPAPGQGIIAVEVRRNDARAWDLASALDDPDGSVALRAERAVVERLGGGCQMPIGAFAHVTLGRISVTSIVISPDGARAVRADASGSIDSPEQVGRSAADALLSQGANEILADAKRALSAAEGQHG